MKGKVFGTSASRASRAGEFVGAVTTGAGLVAGAVVVGIVFTLVGKALNFDMPFLGSDEDDDDDGDGEGRGRRRDNDDD